MYKKIIYLLCLALLAGFAGSAVAQNWDEGRHLEDPEYITDHLWVTCDNWQMGICPSKTASDGSQWAHMADPNANLCIVRAEDIVSGKGISSGTYGHDNRMEIYGTMDGTWLDAGRGGSGGGYTTESVGYILIDGGVVNLLDGGLTIPNHFNNPPIARGTVQMDSGTVNAIWVSIGQNNGIGRFYFYGGTVNLTGSLIFHNAWDDCTNPTEEGEMDIEEGVMILDNNHVSIIQGYIDAGWITVYGVTPQDERYYVLDYDVTTPGKTTLAGIDPATVNTEKAWGPNPKHGSIADITDGNITLDWHAGDAGIYKHDVYFGTTDSPAYVTQTNEAITEYSVAAGQLETTYYWKIDEVDEGASNTIEGDLWYFTTADYLTVDDFDANDISPWEVTGNVEIALVNNNSTMEITCGAGLSGSTYLAPPPQSDWTQQGLMAMRLSFLGDLSIDATATLSVTVNNTTVSYDNAEGLLQTPVWTTWYIPYATLTGLGADISNVTKVQINVSSGGADLVLDIDNIELTLLQCTNSPAGDASGDCEVDLLDVASLANEWLVSGYGLP